ncbi:sn-glycerol-3-phosphate ABC transporter ATP-binding protein UgpC [Martelella mediterranea]|uniref:ABC transporter ATP-binding protein n=1 Tax=Martelella mediterranea TaxID=293089 RepID=UPI001E4D4335|nr:sn-glycerol-3-phosphate ABC transporter ATP-binding protein UgpC [Martelella mediterranea]MCD1636422.1 sn-glycerol-3-phosphate ABC transporter ATP-binding protein UgpC [Martelella mediterranea]
MSHVSLKNAKKAFGASVVIPDLSLEIEDGSFTVLIGPSGCGKSTLLRMVAGLEKFSEGRLEIGGRDVTELAPSKRGIAMVFQSYALYPHMTVRDNVSFGLRLAKTPKAEIDEKVARAARILQLEPLLDRKPAELSGGQRQRVAIGRSIVRDPDIFLFDEPLSNLDAALRSQMRVELMELHREIDATMIYVTHDQVEAMTMADQIVVMNAGSIEQVGSPLDLYDRPATPFVAGFIGSPRINFFQDEQAKEAGGDLLGVRPEDLRIVTGQGRWHGKVRLLEQLGSDTLVHVVLDDGNDAVVRTDRAGPELRDQEVSLDADPASFHVFCNGVRMEALLQKID